MAWPRPRWQPGSALIAPSIWVSGMSNVNGRMCSGCNSLVLKYCLLVPGMGRSKTQSMSASETGHRAWKRRTMFSELHVVPTRSPKWWRDSRLSSEMNLETRYSKLLDGCLPAFTRAQEGDRMPLECFRRTSMTRMLSSSLLKLEERDSRPVVMHQALLLRLGLWASLRDTRPSSSRTTRARCNPPTPSSLGWTT